MKAEEMRIGNYYDCNGRIEVVNPNTIEAVWTAERSWCKPIPLSEEWLLNKFKGFILYGWDDMKLIRFKDETSDFTTTFELEIIDGKYYYEGGLVEFVHDLQNCYYYHANQKKELTIEK